MPIGKKRQRKDFSNNYIIDNMLITILMAKDITIMNVIRYTEMH
jgi:hypothetical protein